MFKKYLSIVIATIIIFNANSALVFAQTNTANNPANIVKVKAEVLKRSTGGKKRVRVKMLNGAKLNGEISEAGEDSFTLIYSKTKQSAVIAYRDVERVEGRGLAGGAKIGMIVGIAAGATLTVLYIAFQNAIKDN